VCGRYGITLPPEAIRQLFQIHGELPNWPAYYNAAPTTALPVVRHAKDGRELVLMQWGLIPWFSKDGKASYSTINARAEGIRAAAALIKPANEDALTERLVSKAVGNVRNNGPELLS
jgi:putative SOS response-associated peptidase YedK